MVAIFIHQRPDWPHFRWSEATIGPLLAATRHRQGRLVGRMEVLGLARLDEANLHVLTEDVLKTSEIEGERLDADQVRSSLARRLGLDIGALAPTDRHVDGIVEMTLDATRRHAEPLTTERLFGWHAALFPTGWAGMSRIAVGRWRDDRQGPMQVVSGALGRERVHFEAPPAAALDHEIARFLAWFEARDGLDPVLRAGLAHLWFVTIHPFDDGNGRIARAIGDMALARSEGVERRFYSLSAQIRRDRAAYYRVLEATQRGDLDVTAWLVWFLASLDRAFEAADTITGMVLEKARFWERHAGEDFNPRQRAMIERLQAGFVGKLTTAKWAALSRCSQDTALRDIEDLIRRGILARGAAGGRSASYEWVGTPRA